MNEDETYSRWLLFKCSIKRKYRSAIFLIYNVRDLIILISNKASRKLTITVVLSILVLFLNALWLNRLPEPFYGADSLSDLCMNFLQAIVASYVFYIIVNVYPQYKKEKEFIRDKMDLYIFGLSENVIYHFKGFGEAFLLNFILSDANISKLEEDINFNIHMLDHNEEFNSFLRNTFLSTNSKIDSPNKITWADVFIDFFNDEDKIIDNLLEFKECIPNKIKDYIYKIKHSIPKEFIKRHIEKTDNHEELSLFDIRCELFSHLENHIKLQSLSTLYRAKLI
ncbi:hypothetical protein NUK36_17940 [Aeromonas hydrophila]|uniref:hypothetical protein n=1 Tax=Aeromonas hydrophila TaxID=644 RepID=UPI00214D4DBE|nr:hypothetical protein [Aeromonas hydrophila]MCR3904705.1 hypothetical protein [Aeromonas hydrophila]